MVLNIIILRHAGGGGTAAAFIPIMIIFFMRTTLVAVDQNGLNFYFLEIRFGKGYVVADKMSLPFDQIAGMKVKAGKVLKNTYFTFSVMQNGKLRKIKTSASAKMRKAPEHEECLKALLQALENQNLATL